MAEMNSDQIKGILDSINEDDIKKLSDDEKEHLIKKINEDKNMTDNEKFLKCGVISFGSKEKFIKGCQKFTTKHENK